MKKLRQNAYRIELLEGFSISPTFNVSDMYLYHGDEEKILLKPTNIQSDLLNSPREAFDVLDTRSIITRHGKYTQYLVHWQGKPNSEDAWVSCEELKQLDDKLWQDLNLNLRASSFQQGENDVGA